MMRGEYLIEGDFQRGSLGPHVGAVEIDGASPAEAMAAALTKAIADPEAKALLDENHGVRLIAIKMG